MLLFYLMKIMMNDTDVENGQYYVCDESGSAFGFVTFNGTGTYTIYLEQIPQG